MAPPSNAVGVEAARRIAVHAQALDGSARGVLSTVRRLGWLQMDPIATGATPQERVLFSPLGPFDRSQLSRLLWKERKLFEYDAFIYPIEDLPLQRARMARRRNFGYLKTKRDLWSQNFMREHARLRRYVLREIERNGPLLSRDLKDDRPVEAERHAWWGQGPLRLMMDMLAGRGQIAVAGRVGTHRLWDLPERVWPETETLSWREAERELEERRRRRLGAWLQAGEWHAHPESSDELVTDRVTLLSPFDGLVKDRDRAEALWGFRYRLEMYVPRAKREYGYYVLPLLVGDQVVGRAEPRFDRKTGALEVLDAWGDTSRLDEALAALEGWLKPAPA